MASLDGAVSGDLDLRDDVVLRGAGREVTIIDGGGLFVVGTTIAHGSIIAGNDGLPDYDNCTNSGVVSRGHNIESTDTCELGASGDQPATAPLLGPLAENGGPTRTHALLASSPAIDAGDSQACLATDQPAVKRPFDGDASGTAECDIGAFEREPPGLVFADGFESGTRAPGRRSRTRVHDAGGPPQPRSAQL